VADGIAHAERALDSGTGAGVLERLVRVSNGELGVAVS